MGWGKRFLKLERQFSEISFSVLDRVGGRLLLKCNFSFKTVPEMSLVPLFYRDIILSAREDIIEHTPTTRDKIENDILWNNHLVTIGGKSAFYMRWYDVGVWTLSDILDEEGKFLSLASFSKKVVL